MGAENQSIPSELDAERKRPIAWMSDGRISRPIKFVEIGRAHV